MVLNELVLLLKTADCAEKINERRDEICSALAGEEGEVFYQMHLEQVKREEQ